MRRAALILGYIWATPLTILGIVLSAALYWPVSARWRAGALELVASRSLIPRRMAAVTYGYVITYRLAFLRETTILPKHERIHVRQCMILGPFMPLAYALASVWSRLNGTGWYEGNWFEKQARRLSED